MTKVKVAINGFGRIGRAFFRLAYLSDAIEIVAINDLADPENLAYLLSYDSVYGPFPHKVVGKQGVLIVDGKEILLLAEPNPEKLPWKKNDIDIALESTGFFASYEKAEKHLTAGAKRVVVSAPVKDEPRPGIVGKTVLMGVNESELKVCDISSNASCTTNAGSPLISILDEEIGIERAVLNTIHGYTSTQSLVDGPSKKDPRRGRAAAINIIPSTTGAAIATTKAIKSLARKFDGVAIRVPVPAGSLVDVTFVAKRRTSVEEVNEILTTASTADRWKGLFGVTTAPIVSSDIIGDTRASIADLSFTKVVDGTLVKVLAWYDNEMGYTHALVEHVIESGRHI